MAASGVRSSWEASGDESLDLLFRGLAGLEGLLDLSEHGVEGERERANLGGGRVRGDALGQVAGGDLSRGGFDGAQGEEGAAHEDTPGPASDEDDDDAGDREVRGRGAQGVLHIRQGQGDRHVSGEVAGVLLVHGDDEGAPAKAGLGRGDGDWEGVEGGDGRGARVDDSGRWGLPEALRVSSE